MSALAPEDLRASPNPLAGDYTRFRVGERLLLSGHSHQAWPDVALEGVVESFDDAARDVDEKWGRAFVKADVVRAAIAALLGDPAADVALGQNTHELVVRFLSALDLRARPRLVTTDGEFHTLRRQLARLGEAGLDVVRVEPTPADTLAERLAGAVDDRTAAVLVSAVLYETARIVPGLDTLAVACDARGTELLVDVYHGVGPRRISVPELGLESAWVTGGGYKYLQLGEGACYLRLPPQAAEMRPVVTGWFAEFDALAAEPHPDRPVPYGAGASRFAGATYDPTSHYRAARVLRFIAERGLTPLLLEASYRHQVALLAREVDALDLAPGVLTRDRAAPLDAFAGFLALESPHAGALRDALAAVGVATDSRGRYLRLGPAPYLSDDQLSEAVARLGRVAGEVVARL
ncbi:MAG: kynureninase [Solirubrobacteraceae bacterium]|nr:kynureninase [Solirubrobacteraceae bacterium]